MLGGPPAAGGPEPRTADRVERLVAASYDFALANHQLHHVLFHEAGYAEEDTFARARTVLAELIETGQAAGELDVAPTPPWPPTSSSWACTGCWSGRRTGPVPNGRGWSPA
ncbi:MAG TPA: hypothetical protein VJ140_16235 [Actinomycetota bacterium]|nr:hypothetical protein [Actinomycetota bacterium]